MEATLQSAGGGKSKSNGNGQGKHDKHDKRDQQSNQSHSSNKSQRNRQNGKGKWSPPDFTKDSPVKVNGHSVYTRDVNGKTYNWCKHCGKGGRWVLSHHSGTHDHNFKSNDKKSGSSNHTESANHLFIDPTCYLTIVSKDKQTNFVSDICQLVWDFLPNFIGSGLIGLILLFINHHWPVTVLPAILSWVVFVGTALFSRWFEFQQWLKPPKVPTNNGKFRRRHHRSYTRWRSKWKKKRYVPGSIKDHGLHRKYPLRLRNQGHYYTQAPTVAQRMAHCRRVELFDTAIHRSIMANRIKQIDPNRLLDHRAKGHNKVNGGRKTLSRQWHINLPKSAHNKCRWIAKKDEPKQRRHCRSKYVQKSCYQPQ